jgi:hypothetical protein
MAYIIGVSSGFFAVTGPEEKMSLLGLFRKAQSSITRGVQFVQLDLESLSEFEEPNLKEKMEKDIREKLGIRYGIHSETKAAGVEAAELDSAIRVEYERAHKRIIEILKKSREIGAIYVLVHSSESTPFLLLERELQSSDLVDFEGNSFADFLEKNKWLIEWFLGGKNEDIVNAVIKAWEEKEEKIIEGVEHIENAFKSMNIQPKDFIFREIWHGRKMSENIRSRVEDVVRWFEFQFGKKYAEFSDDQKKIVKERIKRNIELQVKEFHTFLMDFVQSKSLHYGPERLAYYFVAKWMEEKNDPLWNKIVNAAVEFFSKRDGKSREEWLKKNNIKKISIDDENFIKMHELWVPAVSAKYIYGHFFPKRPDLEDPKKYLDGMFFALEPPMGGRGIEEWHRLSNPLLYYYLVEEINRSAGKDILAVAMDFEHMLSSRINPELVIELLPQNAGKYVRVLHVGWPATLAPAHMPILLGSEQQEYLYKLCYLLRKKGFGTNPSIDHFIIFERGGPETFQESIISLRKIVEFLEKDTKPEDLPLEFRGIGPKEIGAIERQLAIIREHAFEPLRGLITVPEETYGFFGEEAKRKGKIEEWRRERYR